ncbi:hypothetical protein GWI33_020930 [Rhynchophorus ferrugineus]|uniref:Carbohydrate kinase PfkB domain-containing protein n=1 Tax=Rhynchophorus ferrugineus TaxID=354439 RepID=A0A834M3W9_RHYFE|nr:hypothetical protein GWI33_020930 [Rhynchophorus ferrugineus]
MQLSKGITILNGAPALKTFDQQILTLPTLFCVNETEASIFSGQLIHSISDAELAAKKLIAKGCKSVLITLGEQGALYLTEDSNKPALRVVSPKVNSIDTTGAGDAFLGGLAYFLAVKGYTIEKAIEAACIVAADSVTKFGTQISFPGPEILKSIKI